MKSIELEVPELGLLAITRAALGAGVGLLVSSVLDEKQRRAAGIALILVGVLTTIPFAVKLFGEEE